MLLIQNPGIAPVEGFLTLGISTTRNCGVNGTIGQFGSGSKMAVGVLLRAGLKVVVYCGKTRLDFYTRDDEVNDGLVRTPIKRVMCKMGGTSSRTVDLNYTLDFGSIDWLEVGMALREFISNAIDRTIREENGEFIPALQDGRLVVAAVDDAKVRARDDCTRVYIEMNDDVQRYLMELPKRFLHFSKRPEQVKQSMLSKNRGGPVVVYRAGVFVREIEQRETAVYDYNFKVDELQIDESRNSSEYAIKAAIARLYRTATTAELVPVFETMVAQTPVFEDSLDSDYIISRWDEPKAEQKKNWRAAWQKVAADAVMCGPSNTVCEFVARKGYSIRQLRSAGIVEAAARFGIRTDASVLSDTEQKGREKLPATKAAEAAVTTVWGWLVALDMTDGKDRPPVGCFKDHMNGGSRMLGFCDETGVYLAEDHASGVTKMVLKTALEEISHWITGATDCSRDFQDFLLRVIVEKFVESPENKFVA
jgi:hypothetical protein